MRVHVCARDRKQIRMRTAILWVGPRNVCDCLFLALDCSSSAKYFDIAHKLLRENSRTQTDKHACVNKLLWYVNDVHSPGSSRP